jgi:hypothetical protein
MVHGERRRDRIWKEVISIIYKNGKVRVRDIDVELTETVETKEKALEILEKEGNNPEDHLEENQDGSYTVIIDPDASVTTKRTVLKTMARERYGFLVKDEEKQGIWRIGPWLEAILSIDYDGTEMTNESQEKIAHHILTDTDMPREEKCDMLEGLL